MTAATLTAAQASALRRLQRGPVTDGQGVSLSVVRALADRGLATVEEAGTRTETWRGKTRTVTCWTATAKGQEMSENELGGLQVGDTIQLLSMPDDPSPIEPGTIGVVTGIQPGVFGDERTQVQVEWEAQRSLALVVPPDEFEIIRRSS